MENILDFYRQTSCFTDLGLYKDFARKLPDDIKELSLLQRYQIIHPVAIINHKNDTDPLHGDLSPIPADALLFENERFHVAVSILAELLRRDPFYSKNRKVQDKLHLCCREQSILLSAILKAKGIPARARSGFAMYPGTGDVGYDHWITEWYDSNEDRWKLTDADCCMEDIDFNPFDMPYEKFIFGAQAYLALRKGTLESRQLRHATVPPTFGMKAALWGLFFDYNALMNNEIFFWHKPRYIQDKNYELSEADYSELDELAELMLNPNDNFEKLRQLWIEKPKFHQLAGGFN